MVMHSEYSISGGAVSLLVGWMNLFSNEVLVRRLWVSHPCSQLFFNTLQLQFRTFRYTGDRKQEQGLQEQPTNLFYLVIPNKPQLSLPSRGGALAPIPSTSQEAPNPKVQGPQTRRAAMKRVCFVIVHLHKTSGFRV